MAHYLIMKKMAPVFVLSVKGKCAIYLLKGDNGSDAVHEHYRWTDTRKYHYATVVYRERLKLTFTNRRSDDFSTLSVAGSTALHPA
jgi:hypothetical protein